MERQYVGIDLHRRRSVIYQMDEGGERLSCVRVDNDPWRFAEAVSRAPEGTDVVIEATYGWYWAADLLADLGYVVHLANPHGNDWGHRRVKNDERDAGIWPILCAGSPGRGLDRASGDPRVAGDGRFRFKLSNCAPGSRPRPCGHGQERGPAVSQRHGGVGGAAQPDSLELPDAYLNRLGVLRDLVEVYDREISSLDRDTHLAARPSRLQRRPGHLRRWPGVRRRVRG